MKKFIPPYARYAIAAMRWITILTCFIWVTALTALAGNAKGQVSLDQRVSVSFEQVSLKEALSSLSGQLNIKIMYSGSVADNTQKINLKVKDQPLRLVLGKLLTPLQYGYTVSDNVIIIKKESTKKNPPVMTGNPHTYTIKGKVTDEKGNPLVGATVRVKGSTNGTQTDENGNYELDGVNENATIVVTFIGYEKQEIKVNSSSSFYNVRMNPDANNRLKQVSIVYNGYEDVPEERATGSFAKLDSGMINRRVSTNIIDRLEGITSGLVFNKNQSSLDPNTSTFSIRGRSTIFANTQPLIVVDNFPYEGDINNINPNDVENITILKDAAAASIWGARSGNGVVVITTKKGKLNQPLRVDLNSSVTAGEKPNLYYSPNFLDASNFIDVEKYLFGQGFYDATLSSTYLHPVVTPVVDILNNERNGTISAAAADAQINALRSNDVRKDFSKYFYRNSFDQQHSLSFSGGGQKASYLFSVGYDDNLSDLVRNDYSRLTLNSNDNFYLSSKLQLSVGLHYTLSMADNNNPDFTGVTSNGASIYPYAQLTDSKGNPLQVARDYPESFIAAQSGLLDWAYRPLQDLRLSDNTTKIYDTRINPSIRYQLTKGLSAEVRYQFEKSITDNYNLQDQQSYYVRNLVNSYTQQNGTSFSYPIPIGDILDRGYAELTSNSIRGQLNFNQTFHEKHNIAAIIGVESHEIITSTNTYRLYGYDNSVATNIPVDYVTMFNQYQNVNYPSTIPYTNADGGITDEFRSYFANASYTYNDRYIISGSLRFDQSNLFGVNTNQKGVPLWSTGLGWDISKEPFYQLDGLPYLKLRATYGSNGNIDKTVTAFTTGQYVNTFLPTKGLLLNSPPDPYLRWEKINIVNIGADFETKNRILSGTIEYYHKDGVDLLGYSPLDPATGFNKFKSNIANIAGNGFDLTLQSKNLNGAFKWSTTLLFSKTTDKVTKYNVATNVFAYLQSGDGTNGVSQAFTPMVGKPVFSVFSLKWAGLDPANGDPRGYLNGQVSKDYASILNSNNQSDLVFNGSATPTIFGSLRNDFAYKGFTLSVNITYKLGYYFRRPSIDYGALFGAYTGNKDFTRRWKQPGDEKTTSVPSMIYPYDASRDNFYTYSQVLVDNGDHIRLQDLRFSYDLNKNALKNLPVKKLQLYFYASNLGILWKANKDGLDPDYVGGYPAPLYPNPKTLSLGLNASF